MVRMDLVDEGTGLAFFDPVENAYAQIDFPTVVDPTAIKDPDLPISVQRAVTVRTDRLAIETVPEIIVRDDEGRPVPTESTDPSTYAAGTYVIEISKPLKLYLAVSAPITVTESSCELQLGFGGPTDVIIGARLHRSSPRATITTTQQVSDLFAAISVFGSAIQSWGPDRSYSSLRGHPPRLEIGETLDIPEEIERPATGVTLELPADPLSGVVASPLAYYLGADLVPSKRSQLVVSDEPLVTFDPDRSLGRQCTRLLDRILFLDCLARRNWKYDIQLTERTRLADRVSIDFHELADVAYPERLHRYLEIPMAEYEALIPDWRCERRILPTPRAIRSLPYLTYDLAALREPTGLLDQGTPTSHPLTPDGGRRVGGHVRSEYPTSDMEPSGTGDHRPPIGLDRALPSAFENRLNRGIDDEAVSVVIVCNDEKMVEELDYVWSVYDNDDDPFVSVRRFQHLTCRELRDVLAEPIDYFHYIGHIHPPGFTCPDGYLDLSTVDDVGVEVAFLNACESLDQALEMIDSGSAAAIATRSKVLNEPAVQVGQQVAELLIRGFPIGRSLDLVRPYRFIGHQYTVLGDPSIAIAQAESGVPYCCEIEWAESGEYTLTLQTMLTSIARAGSAVTFRVGQEGYYLNPTKQQFTVDQASLRAFFSFETVPVLVDGELRWSNEPLDRLVGGDGG